MTKQETLNLITGNNYYSLKDLRFNNLLGINLSKDDFTSFLNNKDELIDDNTKEFKILPLRTFNSKHCFYVDSTYIQQLKEEYMGIMDFDIQLHNNTLISRNVSDVVMSSIYSEIEGTLRIENVPTTRKRIRELINNDNPTEKNDIIVKNMINAFLYIQNEKPAFTKDNLHTLYDILSKNCLDEDQKLKIGSLYRDDDVSVDGFDGAPTSEIDQCMNTLFDFVNDKQNQNKYGILLPFICQYYILYIHPYFDFNGRTARMVSFWLNYILELTYAPLFMSDAINETKQKYYNALRETRTSRNDLTYFLGYILETSIQYCILYRNLEEIRVNINKSGNDLTQSEWMYLKKIIIHNPNGFFTQKMFQEYIQAEMTKAGALKLLNNLVDYGILEKNLNRKKEAIYKIKDGNLVYSL